MSTEKKLTTIKEMLRKIKALADRGIQGEATVAKNKLKHLLEKYGLTIEEIEEDLKKGKRESRSFTAGKKSSVTILIQTIKYVVDDSKHDVFQNVKLNKIYTDLTLEEYLEVQRHFIYYKKLYAKELQSFLTAFILKHEIYSMVNQKDTKSDITEEEKRKLRDMMSTMDNATLHTKKKQITSRKALPSGQ